jgi:hypothetical protein
VVKFRKFSSELLMDRRVHDSRIAGPRSDIDISNIRFQSPSTVDSRCCDLHTALKIAVLKAMFVGDVKYSVTCIGD